MDYDRNGLLDIFAAGTVTPGNVSRVELWRQGPAGTFTLDAAQSALDAFAAQGIQGRNEGVSAWGDYDNDGDPDLIISSTISGGCLTKTYRNDPTGTMVVDSGTGLDGLPICYFYPGWGDFDNDGDLDLAAWDHSDGTKIFVNAPPIQQVEIDIKPGSDPNSINCNNEKGIITVAILTTDTFDATFVDHSTVTFEGASETHVDKKSGEPRRHEEDVDGDTDLVFHFRLGDTNLTCESPEGTLTGETFDGQAIVGTDVST